ncbi:P-loop containing nucleoside triphosphate hydrolase protein [Lasiosphaeris hirsuta]|uniref:P-loop containing nucleoside triphosphate hydrolase protein n=1 Tax=Lasiosphaeris hirsuta TaxID=260670 RepID=A0AA40A893_9PEZI|nr:P-loop containing nucleoside triphosphate hydrolase protein [Lasiosphaeris hirsuta]
MRIHRDLVCGGIGLYDILVPRPDMKIVSQMIGQPKNLEICQIRSVPAVNFLDIPDKTLVDALVLEAIPEDVERYQTYLRHRPFGLGLIAAPGGTGKTTALCEATLSMVFNKSIRKVFGSGPTHVAISNFAERLYCRGAVVVSRCNAKKKGTETRVRRPFVVRGQRLDREVEAFLNVLKYSSAGDSAIACLPWTPASSWTYALSPVNWLLVAIGSDAAKRSTTKHAVLNLHPDDSQFLHDLRNEIGQDKSWSGFCQVVRGEINWHQYKLGGAIDDDEIEKLLIRIIRNADVVLATPGTAIYPTYSQVKLEARGIVIDEAGCMNRADLYSIWGNTLRPLFMAGDIMQLRPAFFERRNQLKADAQMSALEFFQGAGFPVYRLRTQLRMCNGMFDLARNLVYKDVEMKYGPFSSIDQPQHAIGRAFEDWLVNTCNFPDLKPSQAGALEPVWMHTPGAYVGQASTSRFSPSQVDAALELLADFVKDTRVDASNIVIIAPYKPNVNYGNQQLADGCYPALTKMSPLLTADSFQGREGQMAVVIFGTSRETGPGFTSDENRLNVMITRQQSALLLVGDMGVTGLLNDPKDFRPYKSASSFNAKVLHELLKIMIKRSRYFKKEASGRDMADKRFAADFDWF